jgi:hypothetical protein
MVVTVLVERLVCNGLQAGFRFPLLRGLHGVVLIVLRWMVRGVEVEEIERGFVERGGKISQAMYQHGIWIWHKNVSVVGLTHCDGFQSPMGF